MLNHQTVAIGYKKRGSDTPRHLGKSKQIQLGRVILQMLVAGTCCCQTIHLRPQVQLEVNRTKVYQVLSPLSPILRSRDSFCRVV